MKIVLAMTDQPWHRCHGGKESNSETYLKGLRDI